MIELSIIIPVKQNDTTWKNLCEQLKLETSLFEVILIGPDFNSDMFLHDSRFKFFHSKQDRAYQLNTGAIKATRKFIWFLHADSQLAPRSIQTVEAYLKSNPNAIYYFDLSFLHDGPLFMAQNSIGAYFRSRFLKMPFGDQGFFMTRSVFFSLGMYPENALYGEDHLFIWNARIRRIELLPCYKEIFTSARKYKKLGWLLTTINHIILTYKQALPPFIRFIQTRNKKKFTAAVAIFVKTPGHSQVKTRLASTMGKDAAEEFYKLSVLATQRVVLEAIRKSEGHIEAYWAVAEKECLHNPMWNSFHTISQGTGGLGERLNTVYSKLQQKHKRVFLIGADLPHLDFKTILRAKFRLALRSQFIMGETDDGGFYLFGGRNPIDRKTWISINYSTDTTASELKKKLGEKNFILLDNNFDIDYGEDLARLKLHSTEGFFEEQIDVIKWLDQYTFETNT